jgi:hypothetical protein
MIPMNLCNALLDIVTPIAMGVAMAATCAAVVVSVILIGGTIRFVLDCMDIKTKISSMFNALGRKS